MGRDGPPQGGEFPLEATLSCQDFDGRPVLIISARDISERQRAREHDELLLREMEHRVKNLLASVQALARQTLCVSPSPEIFAESFIERLAALSRIHALLIQSRWRGAALHDLVGAELSPYRSEERGHAAIKGDAVFLDPEPALALSLAMHELTTNAAKYGALSVPEGRVEVAWEVEDRGAERYLMLHWAELGGPEVQEPQRRGFGSTLLEQGIISTLGGTVDLRFPPEGVRCQIELPVSANPERQP
ncbi:MAG: sensor histidine kinase [Geminicoccaceae bacterium]